MNYPTGVMGKVLIAESIVRQTYNIFVNYFKSAVLIGGEIFGCNRLGSSSVENTNFRSAANTGGVL